MTTTDPFADVLEPMPDIRVTEKGEFSLLVVRYKDILNEKRLAWRDIINLKDSVARLKEEIEQREAQIMIEGIEGKNAEERKANLTLLCAKDGVHSIRSRELRTTMHALAERENQLDDFQSELSLVKRQLDWMIAFRNSEGRGNG